MLAGVPRLLILAIVSSAGLASGCATIATGGVQAIIIESQPSGAECTLTREGQTLGSLVTPGQITVSLSRHAIKVTCRKSGYQDTGEFLVATREPLALLDAIPVVGLVSLPAQAVDMASGAYAQYPKELRVWLVPSGLMGDFANTAAGLSPAAGSFDGQYFGAFRSRAIRPNFDPIQINVQVVSGRGTGTATTDACAVPGEVALAVESSGAVVGRFQLKDDNCQGSAMTFTGQIKGDRMNIKLVKGMEALLVKLP
jgi:hypothetical protein